MFLSKTTMLQRILAALLIAHAVVSLRRGVLEVLLHSGEGPTAEELLEIERIANKFIASDIKVGCEAILVDCACRFPIHFL